jgi:hypothetical protein
MWRDSKLVLDTDGLTDFAVPLGLIGCIPDGETERSVAYRLGSRLAFLFDTLFAEVSSQTDDMAAFGTLLSSLLELVKSGVTRGYTCMCQSFCVQQHS